jgi:hypothetical protein
MAAEGALWSFQLGWHSLSGRAVWGLGLDRLDAETVLSNPA